MKITWLSLFTCTLLWMSSCKEDEAVVSVPASLTIIKNLAADPPTGYDPVTGAPIGTTGKYSFFRFSDSSIVNHTDSASIRWDIGFQANNIILNGGTSGPGSASGFVYNGLFNDLKEISSDSSFITDNKPAFAIGKTWYSYNGASMVFTPKAGKVFVIKCADGKYVKMEVLSYYKDAPANPNAFTDQARYYTFRYAYQKNGTKKFE